VTHARFPDGFLWGAATSHHQVEGGGPDAVEPSDWTDWTRDPAHTLDGSNADVACEWWTGRAEEDLALARGLGHTAHRMGISWARIEPREGQFDEKALDRYEAILGAARDLGLKTMVTLHHFTLPRWVAARGGFADARSITDFARFADRAVRRLDHFVTHWATINEPSVYAMMAHGGTRWPPGSGSLPAHVRALGNLLRAHAAAYAALKDARPWASVGLVINAPILDPEGERKRDRLVAAAQDYAFTGCVVQALESGSLSFPLSVARTAVPGLGKSLDWLGLNYYGRYRVRFDPRAAGTLFGRHVQEGSVKTEGVDWGTPYPEGLTRLLVRLGGLGRPLFVTENGVCDPTDRVRRRYLVDHVRAVHDAIGRGVDVRGYFHWSLLDNFEWAEGFAAPFGLVAIDRATGARTRRPSARIFERIARENALSRETVALANEDARAGAGGSGQPGPAA
jgi:beta-glucosidase